MSARVLSYDEVTRLLPMAECIDAMGEVLASLARHQLHNPLRSMMRPPDADTFLGLMPSYRSGSDAVYALKTIVIVPGNPARGLDSHQGFVALFDGETGKTRAILDASAVTAIRTAAVSGLATRMLARADAKHLAIVGAGVQAKTHLDAMRALHEWESVRVWSRTPGRASAELGDVEETATAEEALRDADVVCTTTSSREPVVQRAWLADGAHVNAIGSSIAATRELDTQTMVDAALFVDRRESTLNEAGDYLIPLREGAIGPEHIRAELGEILIGAAQGRRDDGELTVFKSLGLAVEDLAAAELVLRRAEVENAGVVVDL